MCNGGLQAHELMDQLKKSLRAEHVLIHEFIVTFFLSVSIPSSCRDVTLTY